jgi:PAS domain S-box-containing protein
MVNREIPESSGEDDAGRTVGEKNRLESLIDSIKSIVWEADVETFQFTYVNKQAERILGYPLEDWKKHRFWFSVLHPDDSESVISNCRKAIADKKDFRLEYRAIAADGSVVWFEDIVTVVVEDDRPVKIRGAMVDITDKKRVERAFRVLNQFSRALMRAENENSLLNDTCKIIVEDGGYIYVWIGYAMPDKTVKPVARAGKDGYAEAIKDTWVESETGKGPTGAAIREKTVVIARYLDTGGFSKSWSEEALRRVFASSIALPLKHEGDVLGALNIYSSEKNSFDEKEVELLSELADNLAYGIALMRLEKRRRRMEKLLESLWEIASLEADFKTLCNRTLYEILQLTSSKYGFFGSIEGDVLVVHAWSEDVMEECRIDRIYRFPIEGAGLWADAVREKRDVIINDYSSYSGRKGTPEGHVPLKNLLFVPVFSGEEVVSLAAVANREGNYDEEDAELIRIFLANVQKVLERARLKEQLRAILENIVDVILIADFEGNIKFVSPSIEFISGYRPEEIMGRHVLEFAHPEDYETILKSMSKLAENPGIAMRAEFRARSKDGTWKHFEAIGKNLGDIPGIEGIMANIRDITERKKLEELYSTVIENTGTGMLLLEGLRVSFANRQAEMILGSVKDIRDILFGDDLERVLEKIRILEVEPSRSPESFEARVKDREGKIRNAVLTVSLIPGTKSKIVSILDVTELKEAERKMRESEERYRTLFKKSRDAIVLTGMDGRIIDCNDAALKLVGMSKAEVIGKPFTELNLIEREDIPYLMELFFRGVREEISMVEIKAKRGDETRWFEVSPTVLKQKGEPYAFLNIIRDVTERKKAEEELMFTLERLKILHELDQGIITGRSFKEIAVTGLQHMVEFTGSDMGVLFTLDPGRRNLVPIAVHPAHIVCKDYIPTNHMRNLNALMQGEVVRIDNLLELNDFAEPEKFMLKAGIRSYIQIPLRVRGEIMGILLLTSKKIGTFERVSEFLKEISDQLAIALQEARLFDMRIESIRQIERNIEQFAVLVDHIRNPLAAIAGITETEIKDRKVAEKIQNQVQRINRVVEKLDKGWIQSEKIREFLKKSWSKNE